MIPPLSGSSSGKSVGSIGSQHQTDGDEEMSLAGKRVVIVEDEAMTQLHLRKIVTRAGMHVLSYALDGAEGVAAVLRDRPDLVLMDINMPGGVTGLEAARSILEQYRVCIVMITAYSDFRQEAEELGASGYVIKPIESASLLPELQRAWKRFHSR